MEGAGERDFGTFDKAEETKTGFFKSMFKQRFILIIMLFFGFANEYMSRNILSIAITEIAKKTFHNDTGIIGDRCPPSGSAVEIIEDVFPEGEYEWSEKLQGIILSSFYWGYIITHIPGGMLVEKLGGKTTFLAGMLITSLLTLLTPFSIKMDPVGAMYLIIVRVALGLSQGFVYASVHGLMAAWIPLKERTRGAAVIFTGIQIGSVLASYFSGFLLHNIEGWSWPFYIYGILGFIWCFFFTILCSKDPESNRFIKDDEKTYLKKELGVLERDKHLPPTPFWAIITNVPVIAIIISQLGIDFSFYVMTTDLPKYLSDVMQFDVEKNGLYSSLPQVLNFFAALFFGFMSDLCINRSYLSVKNTRKLFTTIGCTGLATFLVLASYAGCNRLLAILFFSFGVGFIGMENSKVNNIDLSPNYAPSIIAIVNSIGSLAGIFAPFMVGLLTANSTISEWRSVFWITFAVIMGSSIFYLIFAQGDVQEFNNPQSNLSPENGNLKAEDSQSTSESNSVQKHPIK